MSDMTTVTLESMRQKAAAGGERVIWLAEHADVMSDILGELYIEHHLLIAHLCDKHLDRSGGLLGMVRHKAATAKKTYCASCGKYVAKCGQGC